MMDLNKVLEVFKLNDGSYLVKIDLDACEDTDDNLIMSYKDKMDDEDDKEEVDDLFISAQTEKDVVALVLKYLPMIKNKTEEQVMQSYQDAFNDVDTDD